MFPKKYSFSADGWNKEDFFYCYSPAAKAQVEFIHSDDHVSNSYNDSIGEYDYISMLHKDKFSCGTKISAKASFDKFGAPCLVISNDIRDDGNGYAQYGLHFELVAYEDGLNVWHIVPWPERVELPRKSTLLFTVPFKIEDKSLIDMTLEILDKRFVVTVNGQSGTVEHEDIPESFHVGITACEGVNHFYEMSIE